MKKQYNQATKSDMPLDSSLNLSSGQPKSRATTKPKINAIGAKANGKTGSKSKTSSTNLRSKLKQNNIKNENLEKLNEDRIHSHSFRGKRNQVLIVLLSILLAIAVAFIVIYWRVTLVEKNCFVYIHGDVDAVAIIDGNELSEFASPNNISGTCIFSFNASVDVHSSGNYKIKYKITCYNNDVELYNVVIYEPNLSLFTYANNGYYESKTLISGSQQIKLCEGVAFNELNVDVDYDSFKLVLEIYFERA